MKQLFFTGLCLITVLVSFAQTEGRARLFGFREEVVGGVNPSHTEEGGEQVSGSMASGLNYFIYLQSATRVYPSEMWINGQPYGVSFQPVSSPVERQEFNPPGKGKTILVPKTGEKLIQLVPVAAVESKLSEKGRSLASRHELVVLYKQNGIFYYSVLDQLKKLEPVALQ